MLNLILSVLIAYILTSLWETAVHWKILHASKATRKQWKQHGGILNLLRKAYFSHHTIHHNKTYQTNFFVQFESSRQKELLDSKLAPHPSFRIKCNSYGLNVSGFWESTVFVGVPLLSSLVVFLMLSPRYAWVTLFISGTPMLLSKYLHPILHDSSALEKKRSKVLRAIVNSAYFSFIQKYHFIHHQHHLCNFNLMPGGDYVLGVARYFIKNQQLGEGSYLSNIASITRRSIVP